MRGATNKFFVPREGGSSRYRGHVGGDHDNVVSCIDVDWISMRAVSGKYDNSYCKPFPFLDVGERIVGCGSDTHQAELAKCR